MCGPGMIGCQPAAETFSDGAPGHERECDKLTLLGRINLPYAVERKVRRSGHTTYSSLQ